jgi:antitoxin MazE
MVLDLVWMEISKWCIFIVDTIRRGVMVSKIQKWGNSLAVRIPVAFARELELVNNSVVEMSLLDGRLVVEQIPPPILSLEDLLSEVTRDNLHKEMDFGEAVGNEAW